MTEGIELLIDAGQWRSADELYKNRSSEGRAWRYLPAARLGQRAAYAFVASPGRRDACATHLASSRLAYYLTEAGLCAMNAGDLATARDYLAMALRRAGDAGDSGGLVTALLYLAESHGHLGQVGDARDANAEALTRAEAAGDRELIRVCHSCLGWAAGLAGDGAEAEQHFIAAAQTRIADDPGHAPRTRSSGVWWAEWLVRTGRPGPARALTRRNADLSRRNGWNADVARCERALGRIALATGDTATAGERLTAAAACFRDGDYLTELAETLADLAEYARAVSDQEAAERHAAEAITIAAPRGLVPRTASPWSPAPAFEPAGPRPPRTRTWYCKAATTQILRCGSPPAVSSHGTNSMRCVATKPSIKRRASTGAGQPRPTRCMPGWSRQTWTLTHWPVPVAARITRVLSVRHGQVVIAV